MPEVVPENMGWWTIHGSTLLSALHAVHQGGHPDIVYAELYANSDICTPDAEDDD